MHIRIREQSATILIMDYLGLNRAEYNDDMVVKIIPKYTNYAISNYGTIYNLLKKTRIKPNKGEIYTVSIKSKNKKTKNKSIHKLVAKCFLDNPEDKQSVVHIDKNKKNNKYDNLRYVDKIELLSLAGKRKNTSSSSKGVYWDTGKEKWVARITIDGKREYLGAFSDEIEAAKTYNKFARSVYGEHAYQNKV